MSTVDVIALWLAAICAAWLAGELPAAQQLLGDMSAYLSDVKAQLDVTALEDARDAALSAAADAHAWFERQMARLLGR